MVVTLKKLVLFQSTHKKINESQNRNKISFTVVRVLSTVETEMNIIFCQINNLGNEYRQNTHANEIYSQVFY